jgi:hypothetical protein
MSYRCSRDCADHPTDGILRTHDAEVRAATLDQAADDLEVRCRAQAGPCFCGLAADELRRMAAAARPDRVPTRAEIADQVRVVDASQRHVDDLLAAYHRTAARPDTTGA